MSENTFYLTTAINYANGSPHIGHAYEAIVADIIARYHRIYGRKVYFLTGTDEHGQKIAQTAASQGLSPIQLCDKYSEEFKALNRRLKITNDYFIRTTDEKHKIIANDILRRCLESGDIYLGYYSGWYNVREETFVPETEAELNNYTDPTTGIPLKKMDEPSYFFKLSKYQDKLINHIKNNPDFIQPSYHQKIILNRLEDELHDLSISRTTFRWGIEMYNDPNHVLYVWFDALTNYISGINDDKIWPPNLQIIGKDIMWFHAVIWPCMLMSINYELPKTIFAHGFVHDEDGRKMSKSLGNVINPNDILDKYPSDSFRLSLINQNPFGNDISFGLDKIVSVHNSDLADTIGNLVHRCGIMVEKYCSGYIPDVISLDIFDVHDLLLAIEDCFRLQRIHQAYDIIISKVRDINVFLNDNAPWKIKNSDPCFILRKRNVIIKSALEAIYVINHYLSPFIPDTSDEIFKMLGANQIQLTELSNPSINGHLRSNKISKFSFSKLQLSTEIPPPTIIVPNAIDSFYQFDIRIGIIENIEVCLSNPKLFCCIVNIGHQISIVSGLVGKIPLENLLGAKVLVVTNLNPVVISGVLSEGLILSVNNKRIFSLINILGDIGDKIYLENNSPKIPHPSVFNFLDKKQWDKLSKKLKTDNGGYCTYASIKLCTSTGDYLTSPLPNSYIN